MIDDEEFENRLALVAIGAVVIIANLLVLAQLVLGDLLQ